MSQPPAIRVVGAALYLLPVETRVPLKFGPETLTSVTCARVQMTVSDDRGRRFEGWGETPLSVQWAWPGELSCARRLEAMISFCRQLTHAWTTSGLAGHPLEVGHEFQQSFLLPRWTAFNQPRAAGEAMPWLAALVGCSAFDLALHDAYGQACQRPIYELYGPDFLRRDLAAFLEPAADVPVSFTGRYPKDYLLRERRETLRAWHLVGGLDPLTPADLTGSEPADGHPVLLADWIRRDGLRCLKIKLRGNDDAWDFDRLVRVGEIALAHDVEALSADFNCTVQTTDYVNDILDRLHADHPRIYERILYVEQPFPYELEQHRLDVRSVAARKPLFLDESAHDWRLVRLGRELGWTGVALKTCKTQTGAILSACWARAHGLALMVQDLTNPMLAQIPHLLLAAHTPTIMGVETNAMQFYPDASAPEATVHPGLYRRRAGLVNLATVRGPGFGYRVNEIPRQLPAPVEEAGT
ncbi:MAG: mandelate racemase/muconate lactonizing enzyme family protein [Verrucomicrobiota bacterium]|jgi:L-alanine-DL-glutamate epimerase-like enolase superfamily enzyme